MTNDDVVEVVEALRIAIEAATWRRGDSGTPRLTVYHGITAKWSLTLACAEGTQDGAAASSVTPMTIVRFTPELAKLAREKAEKIP